MIYLVSTEKNEGNRFHPSSFCSPRIVVRFSKVYILMRENQAGSQASQARARAPFGWRVVSSLFSDIFLF